METLDDLISYFELMSLVADALPLSTLEVANVLHGLSPDGIDSNTWENAVIGTVFLAGKLGSAHLVTSDGHVVVIFDGFNFYALLQEAETTEAPAEATTSETLLVDKDN